jgi:O-antigen/teichoic acid export membrane protein
MSTAAGMRPVEPKRLAVNFLFLSGGEFTAKLLTFASFSYLARTLGPVSYGSVEFTLAVMAFFTLPTDLGLGTYGAREIARNPSAAPRLLREITGLRLFFSLCSMLLLAVFILFLQKSPEQKALLELYGLSLLGTPYLLQWFFQAFDQMHWVAGTSIVRQAAFAMLVFSVYRRGSPLIYVGMIECASVAFTAAYCLYVLKARMRFPWPAPTFGIAALKKDVRSALPIGLSDLAWTFMWYFCTVLLGFLSPDQSLGWFGAGHRIVMASHTFVMLYFFNLLPSISRCAGLPRAHLLRLMDDSLRLMAWAGFLAAPLMSVLAPQVMTLVYGASFHDGWRPFAVLVWVLPMAMLSGHYRYTLVAYNQQKWLLVSTSISAAVAVLLAFALIPWYKGVGAAWALLIANIVLFALVYFAVRRYVVEVPVHRQLFAPLLALGPAALVCLALARWNLYAAVLSAAAVYVGVFLKSDGPKLILFVQSVVRGQVFPDAANRD